MIVQTAMPSQPSWLHAGSPDPAGLPDRTPWRLVPAVAQAEKMRVPAVTVIGTVRDEAVALERSLHVWSRQVLPDWLRGRVRYVVLDDGSSDDPGAVVSRYATPGFDVELVRFRGPGGPERSCTLLLNAAVRQIVESPLVLIQWWDRIPGSFHHLATLMRPHVDLAGIATSGVSRHIGGSSSMHEMSAEQLASVLATVPWRDDPETLSRDAGPIGGHCVPGQASESSALCLCVEDFTAIGGYDERYVDRAGYANVELFRRLMQSGVRVLFPGDTRAHNFHQSHGANRVKTRGYLDDPGVVRNRDVPWGLLRPLDAATP